MNEAAETDPTLIQLFHRAQGEHADKPAIEAGSRTLTYAELGRRSRCLAARLRRAGVGPEVIVGLALPRSPDLVIAMLAVLEAGGAYLPLDPEHPVERLALMLEDSGAPVVLASRGGAERPASFAGEWLLVDDLGDDGGAEVEPAPEVP
ncbi:MAG: AMP-binding protein, partial [Acidobacteria bacterium]|nr:AMP-binding protein [Acidobacteriota bacterium]